MSSRRLLWLVWAALFCGGMLRAEENFARGFLDKAAVTRAAAGVSRAVYPDADQVLVDGQAFTRYHPDGTHLRWDEIYLKVLTEKGRAANQIQGLSFALPYSTEKDVGYTLMEIIKPDGRAVPVDFASQSRIMINPGQMGANIYNPNDKVLQVGVPGLEVGDLLHYVCFERAVQPRLRDTWCNYYDSFESTQPLKHSVYEVVAPRERPLVNIALKDEIKGTMTFSSGETNGARLYRWEAKDVPQMFPEPNMPSAAMVGQRLLLSTAPDWPTISRWYWNLCRPHLEASPAMRQKVAELTNGLAGRQEKIEALFRFVSQEVRYMGITTEDTAPGYEPHDAADTFARRHGVCRDKAALLAAMLCAAGFDAFPVLIHVGTKIDAEIPEPHFNHAIAGVRLGPNQYLLMDPTNEGTKQLLPAYLNDRSYLVATPEGDPLRASGIDPAESNLLQIATQGRIDARGNLRAETILSFEGCNDNAFRNYFAWRKPEERRRFFEGVVKLAAAGARLDEFVLEPEDMLDTSQSLKIRLKFSAQDALLRGPDLTVVSWPILGVRLGRVNWIAGQAGLERRKYPLVTTMACGVKENIELAFAELPGQTAVLPETTRVENETLLWQMECRRQADRLQFASDFRLKATEFSPAQYAFLKDALKKREFDLRQKPIFIPAPPTAATPDETEANMILLDEQVVYELADANNWTETRSVKKQVLTYAGKKENAEIKIGYNPLWEKVTLEKATVAGGSNQIAISEKEVNLMDAGWVGGAPRYPPEKLLVASLPGVEIGRVIEYRIKRCFSNHPFFAALESFQGHDPIKAKKVTLRAPASLPLKTLIPPTAVKLVAKKERQGTQVVYSWEAQDSPPLKREENVPPGWSVAPTVFVSAGAWRPYAADIQAALVRAAAATDGVPEKAAALVGQAQAPAAKLRAIRDFVAKDIRAAGPAFNALPLTALTPAGRVLKEGYGHGADRAVLLSALLEAAGFRPEFVLASGSAPALAELQKPLREIPDPRWFDDVLVRVKLDGEDVYLNDTDQYAALGATGHADRPGLVLPAADFETIRALPGKDNGRSEKHYRIELAPAGDAVIVKTTRYFGAEYMQRHKFFAEQTPEERRRYHQEAAAQISQAARTNGPLETRFDVYPGVEELTVKVEKFAVRRGDLLYLNLPETLGAVFPAAADTRANPLWLDNSRHTAIVTEIVAPPNFTAVQTPPALEWKAPGDAGTVSVAELPLSKAGKNSLRILQVAEFNPALFPADKYDALLELNRRCTHLRARLVLFKETAPAPADAIKQ